MVRVYVSTIIDAAAENVWARVRDFNALPQWHPGIADSMVNSALRYRAQAPLVDSLLKEMGLSGSELTKLGNIMREPVGADGDDELK